MQGFLAPRWLHWDVRQPSMQPRSGGGETSGMLKNLKTSIKACPGFCSPWSCFSPSAVLPPAKWHCVPYPRGTRPHLPPVGTWVAAETLPAPCTHGALRPRPSPGRLFCPRSCHTQVIGESTETSLLKIKHLKLHLIHVCLLFLTHFLFSS